MGKPVKGKRVVPKKLKKLGVTFAERVLAEGERVLSLPHGKKPTQSEIEFIRAKSGKLGEIIRLERMKQHLLDRGHCEPATIQVIDLALQNLRRKEAVLTD